MPRKIGRYHVRQGNADVPFWPLPPDKLDLVAGIETVAWVAPVTTGLVAPPDFGIFDVLIEFTMDQIEETEVTDDSIDDKQTVLLQGKPTINEMDLILLPNRVARATFAVFIKPADTFFEGVLKLWAKPDGQKMC